MQLRTLLAEYLAENPCITSRETGRRYTTLLNHLAEHFGREPTYEDLTVRWYGQWINWRRDQQRWEPGTIRGDAEKLGAIWRWEAARRGDPKPVLRLPKAVSRDAVAWTDAELATLMDAARASQRRIGGLPSRVYWPAMLGVLIDTGERIKAAHALRAQDIDLEARVVTFDRAHRKGSLSDNRCPISRPTARDLAELLRYRAVEPLAPVKCPSLYHGLSRLLQDAGLPSDRSRKFHCLRKTTATLLLRQGGDPSTQLGHADPELTRRRYIDWSQIPRVLPRRDATLADWLRWGRQRLGLTG